MSIPKVLTIAGSDSSGGAGIQADLKTFEARGVYGLSALTVITAQNSLGVQAFHPLPLELIAQQIDSVLTDIGADAVKTGMLLSPALIHLVAEKMKQYAIKNLVVDPVLAAGDGRRLTSTDADRAYITALFPLALIITPNLDEATFLTGRKVSTAGDTYVAAQMLHDMGARYVLVKGGHEPHGDEVVDTLYDGHTFHEYRTPLIPSKNPRGTGCTFASAIAAEVVKGQDVPTAVGLAQTYVTAALRAAVDWQIGAGRGTLYHGVTLS